MATEQQDAVRLEIGHVLFIDIVGYSKLLITEQSDRLEKLKEIVRGTEQFRIAEAEGKLLRLPTGDGGALVFRSSPEAPVLCAIEISRELRRHPELRVRMGIHSGPVNTIIDLNEQPNITGAGINIAQRVMNCGDAGHILLSRHVAEDLEQYPRWLPYLRELGEAEVKHGVRVGIVNLSGDGVGNGEVPKVFQAIRRHHARVRWAQVLATLIALAAITAGLFFVARRPIHSVSAGVEKSIAVLPFENLSDDKQSSSFADGVQDQILTDLSKISDLKVISHTSARQYKSGSARNVREIGRQLGVAYILEGSVQRGPDRVRITANLIDARKDSHLWAETYERGVADLFAIQSELAQSIAAQLQAKLSPEQKADIEERPTPDLVAFELYLQAKEIIDSYIVVSDVRAGLLKSVQLLDEAIGRDPKFLLAYCYLTRAHDLLYFFDLDPIPSRVLLAEAAANAAIRLRPDSAEAHFALGDYYFRCQRDYARAQQELARARPGLPNSTPFFILSGYINRRQNHWPEAERDFATATRLDPRNPNAYNLLADTYVLQRRWKDSDEVSRRVIAAGDDSPIVRYRQANVLFFANGDLTPVRQVLADAPKDMDVGAGQTPTRVLIALVDHNYSEALRVLAASPREDFQDIDFSFYYPKAWFEAMIARAKGDEAGARAAFGKVRPILEQRLINKPEHARTLAVLAQVDAGLGQKELAIQEAQHAVDLMPIAKDCYDGALVLEGLTQVYTWTGERDRALDLLQKLASMPSYISYGRLKVHPSWDPLRGDPRFERIMTSLAPK